MKAKSKNTKITAAILAVSMFQMAMVALAPVVSAMTDAFPGVTDLAVQLATTFLNLVLVIVALLAGRIAKVIGRRMMAVIGMGLFVLTAFLGRFCSTALWTVYVWSGLLGAGTGLFVPAVASMMLIFYEEEERQVVAGLQTSFVNLGGVVLSLVSGWLAAKLWSNAYLTFALAIPALIMSLRFMPGIEAEREKEHTESGEAGKRLPARVWLAALQTCVFAVCYFAYSTNISYLLGEKGFDPTAMAGVATACFMLGGVVCGVLLAKTMKIFRGFTPALAFILVALSYVVLFSAKNIVVLCAASVVGGGSLSFIFPYLVLTVGGSVEPAQSVAATSMIISVAPNLGSFISPVIITNLAAVLFGDAASCRFLFAAILAVLLAGVLIAAQLVKKKKA